ncbi:hypothetical protein SPONL_693 [uncultured Candidatus Thioglobus sp.]|nr:hypothetical protein SPONL_693 [uncultured Candidatus Thioglobus sp.]
METGHYQRTHVRHLIGGFGLIYAKGAIKKQAGHEASKKSISYHNEKVFNS